MTTSKKRLKVRDGDVIAVPLGEGLFAVGLVLHVSSYWKHGMIIGFYRRTFHSIEDIDITALGSEFIEMPQYTGTQCVTTGRWTIVGNSPELLQEATVPELRAAYTLYFKDTIVRRLTRDELKDYPELSVGGCLYYEDKLRRYFAQK